MEDQLRSLAHLLLVAPCFVLALRWYRRQREEREQQTRIWLRLGIVWAMLIFVTVSLAMDHFWSTWVTGA